MSVNEENKEVADVKVGDGGIKEGGEGPSESHDEVTTGWDVRWGGCYYSVDQKNSQIVGMLRKTPPTRNEEFGTTLCLHVLQV